MPDSDLYLCLDQGGHATRAIVFDGAGNKQVEHACPIQTFIEGRRVEIQAGALMEGFGVALREVFAALGADARRIRRAGLATQRSNTVCWNGETLEPLSPVLSWQDRRAPEYLRGLDEQAVHRATGLFPNAHYGASKLAWCVDHLDAVKQAADTGVLRVGPMASYIAAALTGEPAVVDPVNGSRTLLLNLESRGWDAALCRHFGVDPRWLPPVVESRHEFGGLAAPSTARAGTPVVPLNVVTGDLSAAAFSRGRPRADTLYVTLGTGAFVQRIVKDQRVGHPRMLNGMLWLENGRGVYSLEGTVNGAGGALSWLAETEGIEQENLYRCIEGYEPRTSDVPLFLNGVSGLGSPFWVAEFEPRFLGDSDIDGKAFAVVESIVFLIKKNLEAMETVMPAPQRIVVSGGLSRIDGLCRALAVLAGRTVERAVESEATAKGLAYLLADRPENWPVQSGSLFDPDSGAELGDRYAAWSDELNRALGA